MNQYLRWYAGMHKFYRILLLAGMGVGVLGIGSGMATDNGPLFFIGLFWLASTPAVVHVASRFDDE